MDPFPVSVRTTHNSTNLIRILNLFVRDALSGKCSSDNFQAMDILDVANDCAVGFAWFRKNNEGHAKFLPELDRDLFDSFNVAQFQQMDSVRVSWNPISDMPCAGYEEIIEAYSFYLVLFTKPDDTVIYRSQEEFRKDISEIYGYEDPTASRMSILDTPELKTSILTGTMQHVVGVMEIDLISAISILKMGN